MFVLSATKKAYPFLTSSTTATIEERLFNRAFAGYSESDLMVTGDGLLLPRLPSWLNSTRETQHDGSPGVFACSPSKEDFNSRFLEILEALEPIGVEIGVAKIRVPDGWYSYSFFLLHTVPSRLVYSCVDKRFRLVDHFPIHDRLLFF